MLPPLPLDKPSRLSFDTAGVASLLGGDDALRATTAVHVYGKRRWLGWYNCPGSFQMARQLSSFVKSASLHTAPSGRSIDRCADTDPTSLLGLDAHKGPKFQAAHSGTIIQETGYLAALFMNACAAWESEGKVVQGRRTQPITISIADLGREPAPEIRPAQSGVFTLLSAGIPTLVSIASSAVCAHFEDWYAASLILIGIVASGSCGLIIGTADFVFTHPEPAKGSPAGDGILGTDKHLVLLRGTEGAVNSITRGRFSLRFSPEGLFHLRWCSLLFFIQSITQLFLIPQATLFGQIMFLTSLAVTTLYNAWHSSLDKETIHRKMLFQKVLENPTLTKYTLGTRTSAVVFILLVLKPTDPKNLLDELLPNDTKVWKHWKATILEWLRRPSDQTLPVGTQVEGFTQQEKDLLSLLYEDARAGYNGYKDYLQGDAL